MAKKRRLIDRNAAVATLTQIALQVSDRKIRTVARCVSAVELLPTVDAVEVIRCNDCDHVFICNCQSCRQDVSVYCGKFGKHMAKDDFCSYGKRKSGAQPQREDV